MCGKIVMEQRMALSAAASVSELGSVREVVSQCLVLPSTMFCAHTLADRPRNCGFLFLSLFFFFFEKNKKFFSLESQTD